MWELYNSKMQLCKDAKHRLIYLSYDNITIKAAVGISLNLVACALITVWIVEYFGYNAGKNIHFLLLAGVLLVVTRLFLLIPLRRRTGRAT